MLQEISHQMEQILADNMALYIKTLNCHWNVTDPRFHSLHEMFEEQYTKLAEQNDELAERIRQLGKKVSASLKGFAKATVIKEIEGNLKADAMIKSLIASYEGQIAACHKTINACNEAEDHTTADILIQQMRAQEKIVWMLKSHF